MLSKDDLLRDVDQCAREHELNDILPLLWKGALTAQKPDDFEEILELDETDRQVLRHEKIHQ